jgi:hypothetical protein
MACLADYLFALHEGRNPQPDVYQGLYIQDVIESVRRSVTDKGWISVPPRAQK